jgi:hypothetical protein
MEILVCVRLLFLSGLLLVGFPALFHAQSTLCDNFNLGRLDPDEWFAQSGQNGGSATLELIHTIARRSFLIPQRVVADTSGNTGLSTTLSTASLLNRRWHADRHLGIMGWLAVP